MELTTTATNRIHPLMAAAAVSVIIVCAAGTAAITGLLPNSHSATEPQANASAYPAQQMAMPGANSPAALYTQAGAAAQPYAQPYAPAPVAAPTPTTAVYVQPAPVVRQSAPVVHKAPRHVVHHHTETARYDRPNYEQRNSEPAPRQPNYVAMGTGALIGGLVGNQVGSGNGRKLATVAGIIGGGMLGNEMANRNR
jgi:uncharacterized protein YcfJ